MPFFTLSWIQPLCRGAAVCLCALALVGCERPSGDAPSSALAANPQTTQAAANTVSATGFPVTLQSALGQAVIAAAPQRVVTLGLGADDLAVALGVVPVGVSRADWGGDAEYYWPWVRAAIEARGAALPALVAQYPELDVEAIIALRPDVVLVPFSSLSAQAYAQLSRFVPVVAYPDQPYLTPMNVQIDLIAAALGKRAEGDALKVRIAGALSRTARAYPELENKTFAYVRADLGSGNFAVYVAGDPRVDTLSAMGLKLAPSVRDLRASAGHFAHYLGFEHADALGDVDVLVSWFYNIQERDKTAAMPLYAAIPAVRRGSYIALDDASLVMASSSGAPLAVDWMLDRLTPQLAAAARRADAAAKRP